jgi:hypothetical protein
MRTRSELIFQAAKRLGILAAGQSLAAEDFDDIDALLEPLVQELAARRIYALGDAEAIEDAAFLSLADLLALEAAPIFGLTAENLAAKGLVKATIESELEVIGAVTPAQGVLTIERFWG